MTNVINNITNNIICVRDAYRRRICCGFVLDIPDHNTYY